MKTSIKFLTYGFLALAMTITSCTKEGPQGEQGIPGAEGLQGEQGETGPAGAVGNANVQTYVFDLSDITESNSIPNSLSALTEDVVDNDLIIGYLQNSQGNTYYAIPAGVWPNGTGGFYDVEADIAVGTYWVHFYQVGTQTFMPIGGIELGKLKIVIAESNSTTVAGKSSKESTLSKMKNAGVDINDYYAVMDYFGLEY